MGRACARRAKEHSIDEAYHLSNGEVNREHLGRVSKQRRDEAIAASVTEVMSRGQMR